MNQPVFHVPAALCRRFSNLKNGMIVQAATLAEVVSYLPNPLPGNLVAIKTGACSFDEAALAAWGQPVPIDVQIEQPNQSYAVLYQMGELIGNQPIRATIAANPGFSKSVKVAGALGIPVKLSVGQPEEGVVAELFDVLDVYLHRSLQTQPVEFFHSLLGVFIREEQATLWEIQEDDPSLVRHVREDGREILSPRFAEAPLAEPLETFVSRFSRRRSKAGGECSSCEFFPVCRSYFKHPDDRYDCNGVKSLFASIRTAAHKIKAEVTAQIGSTKRELH